MKRRLKFFALKIIFSTSPLAALGFTLCLITNGFLIPGRAFALLKFIDSSIAYYQNEVILSHVMVYMILVSLMFLLDGILQIVQSISEIYLTIHAEKRVEQFIRKKYLNLEYKYLEDRTFYNLLHRIKENPTERILMSYKRILQLIASIIRLSGVLVLLFIAGWWIGLSLLVISVPLYYLSMKLGKSLYHWWEEHSELERRIGYYMDILLRREYAHERILFGFSSYFLKKWSDHYSELNKKHFYTHFKAHFIHHSANLANVVFEIFIYIILIAPLMVGRISLGYIIAVSNSLRDMHFFMQAIGKVLSNISQDRIYIRELLQFIELDEISKQSGYTTLGDTILSIEFRDVCFKYPEKEQYTLKGLSFRISNRRSYSIVGENGAGKSSLIKLLLRFYKPDQGKILVNGIDIQKISIEEYLTHFSAIFQDFARYAFSIKENVQLGNVSRHEDISIIKEILDELDFPKEISMDTCLGKVFDESVDLSGGEWQKLAIARALYSSSNVQILDEPTASLDPIAEANLYEKFRTIMKDKLSIFISHRLGSTKTTNSIMVLSRGRIIEEGTHDNLMTLNGIYQKMYNEQKSWYE